MNKRYIATEAVLIGAAVVGGYLVGDASATTEVVVQGCPV